MLVAYKIKRVTLLVSNNLLLLVTNLQLSVMFSFTTLCYFMLSRVMLCYFMLLHFMLLLVTFSYLMLSRVTLCY